MTLVRMIVMMVLVSLVHATIIDDLSRNITAARFGETPFSEMSLDEWNQRFFPRSSFSPPQVSLQPISFTNSEIQAAVSAGSVNWHTNQNPKGLRTTTRVKNQGKCGSCWVFSTIGALEGAYAIAGNTLTAFSEEFALDCVQGPGMNGCSGGSQESLVNALLQSGQSLPMERNYEYSAYNGVVSSQCLPSTGVAKLSAGFQLESMNEDQMLAYLYWRGPLIVSVKASGVEWQHYVSGVLSCQSGTSEGQLDHGVLIVGYGVEDSVKYWLVKNSWTPMWGENGYLKLTRGVNECGVALLPVGLNV